MLKVVFKGIDPLMLMVVALEFKATRLCTAPTTIDSLAGGGIERLLIIVLTGTWTICVMQAA